MSQSQRQLREAWGQFLSRFEWDWFVSLTFRDEVFTFRAHRLVGRFVSDLERAAGIPIFWFRADEYGERLDRFHIHLLIGNVGHMRRLAWMDEWNRRAGYARILPFDRTKGAAYYCAKYVTKQAGDWDLSNNLLAFSNYQPALPLTGSTRTPASPPESNIRIPTEIRHLIPGQAVLSSVSDWASMRARPLPEPEFMSVYRSEVTRGRGRFRQFFVPVERRPV